MNNINTENPIKHVRLRENLTQQALANYLGVSRQFIIRMEQGCYEPTPQFMDFVKDRGYDPDWFISSYYTWRRETRVGNYGALPSSYFEESSMFLRDSGAGFGDLGQQEQEFIYSSGSYQKEQHPLLLWRRSVDLSLTAVAIKFCLHIPTLQDYEYKAIQQSTPVGILEGLRESGYSDKVLQELERRYQEHRNLKFGLVA